MIQLSSMFGLTDLLRVPLRLVSLNSTIVIVLSDTDNLSPYSFADRPPQGDQFYGPQFQNGNQGGGKQQPFFQYSQCNGKRKALAIGCNYIGTSQALGGCINDAHNMVKFLCDRFGYKQEDIVVLTDDARNPRQIPTRENMIAAMNWLVDGARPNDSLFFH